MRIIVITRERLTSGSGSESYSRDVGIDSFPGNPKRAYIENYAVMAGPPMSEQVQQKLKVSDQGDEETVQKTPEAVKDGGVIAAQPNQEIHGRAFANAHQNDKTLSEPDMIAIEEGETVAEHKARVARIQANRCRFFDSAEEGNGSAADTGMVIDYQHRKIGENFYAGGLDYEEGRDTRSIYEKLSDFGAAAARAMDPEGQKAYIQGQLDKVIGICEGINIAKDTTKADAVAGWTALTDGTVANFLATQNAINDPLFHAVGCALDAMAKDPSLVNLALERVGTIIMNASEHYTGAPNKEKGRVIGETMFALVNPEGSTEVGEAALQVASKVATKVDTVVMDGIKKSLQVTEDMAKTSPEMAQQAKQMLFDYTQKLGMSPQDMESAGIPKGYFDRMQEPPGGGKGDNFCAMSKAEDLEGDGMIGKSGKGGDWPVINERPSTDVVRQTERYSCVSACGEMLSNGDLKQAAIIERLKAPCDTRDLADVLGAPWKGDGVPPSELDKLLERGPWATELREYPKPYRTIEPSHTVVVDGLDKDGNIMIRDPADGTRYEMTRKDFLDHWALISVFRD